jgi:curli biogenesis system outer membrane secretion channel CsgG
MQFLMLVALFCSALGLVLPSANAQVVLRQVIATGSGGDPARATVDALENAIAQVGGMRLSTISSLTMSEATSGGTTTFDEKFQQNIEKVTRGVVKSYTVLESGISPGSGRAHVKIRAVIPTYRQSEQLKRLRLAVIPLRITGQAASAGQNGADFAEAVSASLEAFLAQTRKFAMIDRRSTDTSLTELRRINSRNAPIEETVKIGMRVGADFMVIAALKDFRFQETSQQRVTGRVVTRASAPVGIDVRVIDIATGQIKFAQTYTNPGRLPPGMNLSQYASDIGSDIGHVISTAIYPIAVVAVSGSEVTLNQGGDTVQVGRIYRVVSLGRNLVDPHTKESLGQEESELGRVEITTVTDRTANARLISGSLPPAFKSGSLFARVIHDDPSTPLNVQVSLPSLPGASGAAGAGKSKKDPEDW